MVRRSRTGCCQHRWKMWAKLRGSDDGDRQMVAILAAALSDGLPVVEAACAEALCQGVYSSCVILTLWRAGKTVSGAPRPFGPRSGGWADRLRPSHEADNTILTTEVTTRGPFLRGGSRFRRQAERRRRPEETRRALWSESMAPDTVVTQLAQRHRCRAQQIHGWRRLARTGKLALPAAASEVLPAFVPLCRIIPRHRLRLQRPGRRPASQ